MTVFPRWTHVALPVQNLERSIAWYERYTPLRLLDERHEDGADVAWLSHPEATEHPFILVLASLPEHQKASQPQLGPFGHLGIQLSTQDEVDLIAQRARLEGCLAWEAEDNPAPVGYLCAVSDPDGNVIEFSFGQVVYEVAHAKWGNGIIS